MASEKNKPALPQTGPAVDDPSSAKRPTAQGEELREASQPNADKRRSEAADDEPKFFDTTIAKLVQREVEDEKGNKSTEWVEVMSDNLYPGERLKSEVDAEKAQKAVEKLRDDPNDGKKTDTDSK